MNPEPSTEDLDEAIESIIENDKRDRAKEEYEMSKNKDEKKGGRSPVHMLVERLGDKPGQYKTTKQVADKLGTSESTVRRIANREDGPGPSHYTYMGETQVALYNDDDIKRLEKFLQGQHQVIPADEVR